jgi:hypothetical protein
MIPIGYMAKRVVKNPEDFTDSINYWKHNGYWFFDSPEIIRTVAKKHSIPIEGTSLFYYEAHESEFDDEGWNAHSPEGSFSTNVSYPPASNLKVSTW